MNSDGHFYCKCVAADLTPRPAQPQPLPIYALRMLVRNSEARIEHLTQWINGMTPGDYGPPLAEMQRSLDHAHASLVQHSTELRKRISPAASSLAKAAPSSGAVQSDPITPNK